MFIQKQVKSKALFLCNHLTMKCIPGFLVISAAIMMSCNSTNENQEPIVEDSIDNSVSNEVIDSSAFDLLVKTIEDPDRKEWQNPELVINELGNLENHTVVDIGAGTGYFTFLVAPLAEKVIAVDIDQRFLDVIDSRKQDLDPDIAERIETRLTLVNDPLLNNEEADAVLIVNTYHFLSNRVEYLSKIREGMKPGGTILIVDFKNDTAEVVPPGDLAVPVNTAIDELKSSGFQNVVVDQMSLKYQYIIKANS